MPYHSRHRSARRARRPWSPTALAVATLVAAGGTAVVVTRPGGAEDAAAAGPGQGVVREQAQRASRDSRRTPLGSRELARLGGGAPVPADLVKARDFDSAATRAARARLAAAEAHRAADVQTLHRLGDLAAQAHQAETAARAAAAALSTSPTTTPAPSTTPTAGSGDAVAQGLDLAERLAAADRAVAGAAQRADRADQAVTRQEDLLAAEAPGLATLVAQTSRLADTDAQAALRAGTVVRLADGRVVPTIKVGTPVTGTGFTVTPQVSAWIGEALDELYAAGTPRGPHDAEDLAIIVYNESGGDPHSINGYDSNAAAGMPSFGLMQTVGPTFDAFALPRRKNHDDPVAQIEAGVRYALSAYGSLDAVPGVKSVHGGGPYLPY